MYFEHFGLEKNPFLLNTTPGAMYYSSSHCEATAKLLFALRECKGIALLTGEAGTGKTTLLNAVQELIRPTGAVVCTILNPMMETAQDLLGTILTGFKLNGKQRPAMEQFGVLCAFLEEQARHRRRAILVVDEAQQLGSRTLDRLRLISNLEYKGERLIQLVLSGQPEIRQLLATPQHAALRQRIVARCSLKPLSPAELWNFLALRVARAGSDGRMIFLPEAVERLAAFSACTPRLINVLADNCLIAAYARGAELVDAALVEHVAAEFELSAESFAAAPGPGERTAQSWKKLVGEYATCEVPQALRKFAGTLQAERISA